MIAAISSSWALFLGMALLMTANGLQGSLLGVRASIEAFPTTVTGLLMSAFYFGFLAGSILTPKMVIRVGHVRVFAALASLASTAILIHAVIVNPASWAAMRLVSGLCYAGLYVVAESWLNEKATNENRGQLLSVYMALSMGGMAVGQGLLNVGDPGHADLFILVSILVSLALIPMLLSVNRGPVMDEPSPISIKEVYRASPTGVVAALMNGILMGGVFGMGAVYGGLLGFSVPAISLFMSTLIVGGVLFQWPIGRLSDRYDRRLILTVVTLAAAGLALIAGLAAFSFKLLLATIFLFGGMLIPMYSIAIAYANDHLNPEQMVAASGTLVLVGGIGAFIGPTFVAGAMDIFGPEGFFWALASTHTALGLFILYRMTQRPALPPDEQGSYVAWTARTTPVAGEMYGEAASEVIDQVTDDDDREAEKTEEGEYPLQEQKAPLPNPS
ncbi:MAG: MFS transporter [Geminicoccaceae bacterium]